MIDALRTIVGDDAHDAAESSESAHTPSAVVDPRNVADACAVLSKCAAEHWRVQPLGAGTRPVGSTSRDWRAQTDTPFVALTTRHFTQIEEYKPEDLTITVGAGTSFAELQQMVAQHRQWIPLDPPQHGDITIGSMIATAAYGPLRARYGTPRDHVLGLHIITGDGRTLAFGGQVVKNVAGYDMVRPVVGSMGRLGLITRLSLRLRPLHDVDLTIIVRATLPNALRAAASIREAWAVAALELISPVLPVSDNDPDEWTVLVRAHGRSAEVDDAVAAIERAARRSGVRSFEVAGIAGVIPDIWHEQSTHEASAPFQIRLAALPTLLADTLRVSKSLSDAVFGGSASVAAHAANGVVRIWGSLPGPNDIPGSVRAIEAAASEMATMDGSLSCPAGFSRSPSMESRKQEINIGIAELFDPAGILPGGGS